MKGDIRSDGMDRWRLVFDIGPDPVTGRRRQRSRTVRGSRDDAERELARILSELATSTWADSGRLRVADFVDMWRQARRTQLRPSTLHGYRVKLRTNLVPHMGHRRLSAVTGGALSALYGRPLDRGLSPGTVGASCIESSSGCSLTPFAGATWRRTRQRPPIHRQASGPSSPSGPPVTSPVSWKR